MNWDSNKNQPEKPIPGENPMNSVPYPGSGSNDKQYPRQPAPYPVQPPSYPPQPPIYSQQPHLTQQNQFYEPPPFYEYSATPTHIVGLQENALSPGQRSWYRTMINDQGDKLLGTYVCCQIFFGILIFLVFFSIAYRNFE